MKVWQWVIGLAIFALAIVWWGDVHGQGMPGVRSAGQWERDLLPGAEKHGGRLVAEWVGPDILYGGGGLARYKLWQFKIMVDRDNNVRVYRVDPMSGETDPITMGPFWGRTVYQGWSWREYGE